MTREARLAQYHAKLAANIREAERLTAHVGLRLGVFAALKRLDRQRERYLAKIEALNVERTDK